MTLETAWAVNPLSGDTYEMHPEVDEPHIPYLVYYASEQYFQRHHNLSGMEVIRRGMMREKARFMDSITPRDDGGPGFWSRGDEETFRRDPDRDILLGNFGSFG